MVQIKTNTLGLVVVFFSCTYRFQDKITKRNTYFLLWNTYTKCLNVHHLSCQKGFKKVSIFPPYVKLSLISRSKRTWVHNVPALYGREEGQNSPSCSPWPQHKTKTKGQMLSVVYSTYYKQLKFREKKKKKSGRRPRVGAVTGCRIRVRHFPGAQHPDAWVGTGAGSGGGQGLWGLHAGTGWLRSRMTREVWRGRAIYTDVVTRSMVWLTSFLLESSPLAAFLSFRKFSTVFFMFLSSPGWGVARLRSVLWKARSGVSVWVLLHHSFKCEASWVAFRHRTPLPRVRGRVGEKLALEVRAYINCSLVVKGRWKCLV